MQRVQMMYCDWLKEWLNMKQSGVKESTRGNYSVAIINHILPALGEHRVCEITETKLQETVYYWMRAGRLDGKGGLSKKTVKDLATIVKSSIYAAYRLDQTSMEKFHLCYPAAYKPQIELLTLPQQKVLAQAVQAQYDPRTAGILLCLHTGLRIGEICALQWKHLDLNNNILNVRQTIQRIFYKDWNGAGHSRVVINSPKTENSVREIPLPNQQAALLKTLDPHDGEAYFLTGTHTYLEPRVYRSFYQKFLRKCGLPVFKFHALRHTFATGCIAGGGDYKTVSILLGHASVALTMSLYVHPQIEEKRHCIEHLPLYDLLKQDGKAL